MVRAGGRTVVTVMDSYITKECDPAPDGVYELLGLQAVGNNSLATPTPVPFAITVLERHALGDGRVRLQLAPVCLQVLPASEDELRAAVRSVLCALRVFHAAGFVHRDVRWPNVLRDAQGSWRLIDFELAAREGDVLPTDAIHVDYLPPEAVRGEAFTSAGDIYRVGRLLAEWATAKGAVLTAGAQLLYATLCTTTPTGRPSAAVALESEWLMPAPPLSQSA